MENIFTDTHSVSWTISIVVFLIFLILQISFVIETHKFRRLFQNFFKRIEKYSTYELEENGEWISQLKEVGMKNSDLNSLIVEINHYVTKTKGTTDFSVIQNKVERKLNMRYDQSVAKLAFPTYLGLMGTFLGVFIGIAMFIIGFDGANNITDNSIKNLLVGVLVSMSTSLFGLIFTTYNNARSAESRKNIEEDKNEFYDFVQTELMPTLDVSMVLAITRLHETVDRFEPAFEKVISHFQTTFDKCTQAFGDSFESNVKAVADAVNIMGRNMDKINENINLQQQLLDTFKSHDFISGMDKYIEAANHFVGITKSLDKFEEARRMMLAAAQEAINLQNSYSDALMIPREVAVRCNQILDRIKTFEENINRIGGSLNNRQILGNDIIETIREQINQIRKKDKIALKYFEIADDKLDTLFHEQTNLIDQLNQRYTNSIIRHIDGFEQMLTEQKDELKKRHDEFLEEMKLVVNVEEVQKDFSNLKKLNEILDELQQLSADSVKSEKLYQKIQGIQDEIAKIENNKSRTSNLSSLFGGNTSILGDDKKHRTTNVSQQGITNHYSRSENKPITEKKTVQSQPKKDSTEVIQIPEKKVIYPTQTDDAKEEKKPKSRWLYSLIGKRR